jgi:hypothetical protein
MLTLYMLTLYSQIYIFPTELLAWASELGLVFTLFTGQEDP